MPLKEQRPWYENALLLAVAGSIIVVVGQLAGTIIPIMYGAQDASDFILSVENPVLTFPSSSSGDYDNWWVWTHGISVNITVKDVHDTLRPYRYPVLLTVNLKDENITAVIPHGQSVFGTPTFKSTIVIRPKGSMAVGAHLVQISGIGGDGKRRNCTLMVRFVNEYSPGFPYDLDEYVDQIHYAS
jgi:hypothetical protein